MQWQLEIGHIFIGALLVFIKTVFYMSIDIYCFETIEFSKVKFVNPKIERKVMYLCFFFINSNSKCF